MSDVAIRVEGLSKRYVIGRRPWERYQTFREALSTTARHFGRQLLGPLLPVSHRAVADSQGVEEFWALRDISFEVRQGDRLGIIGRNGAGKSTLLKILSRITEPTKGRVSIKGRVASILEVGTGFHPELTGRENIFLNGAILGMTRPEIRRKFDEIVDFSGVERFVDTPVKRFSSGMYVRLAFAVAAHLETEILLVDEVLAVGDAEFQKKCLGRMQKAGDEGKTVLFISHNMDAISILCGSAIILDAGLVIGRGPVQEQIECYARHVAKKIGQISRNGNKKIGCLLVDEFSFSKPFINSGGQQKFYITISSAEATQLDAVAVLLYSRYGSRVAILDLRSTEGALRVRPSSALRIQGTIERLPLVEGEYFAGLYLRGASVNENLLDLASFVVVRGPAKGNVLPYPPDVRGVVDLRFQAEIIADHERRIVPEGGRGYLE